jgi:hypothetical protein
MTKNEISDLGRIAGILEGRNFIDVIQPSLRDHEWCLRFDNKEVEVSIRPDKYVPPERILEEIRRQLAGLKE